jgi:hypothetical protein
MAAAAAVEVVASRLGAGTDCVSLETLHYLTNGLRGRGVACVNGPLDGVVLYAPAGARDVALFAPGVVSLYRLRELRSGRLLEWVGDLEWPT